jgi:AAA15 family ATPase/GTPase
VERTGSRAVTEHCCIPEKEKHKVSGENGTFAVHIKKLTLHRFKQFKDAEINLQEGLSLLVGGNNSGKSSILQALATWQFCKTLLEIEKGRESWLAPKEKSKTGIGMGVVDFTPMQVPSLSHLWTNLKSNKEAEVDGYTLKIGLYWDLQSGEERHLEIGLSLANDRLFIKTTASNVKRDEILKEKEPIDGNVPRVGYLPPFAGITDREGRLTPAMRARLIGQGLSGGVIRNVLFDLHEENKRERVRLRGNATKIKDSDLTRLRASDPWEILLKTVQATFATEIRVVPFNERYHSYLRVECVKGQWKKDVFKRFAKFNSRDIMVEGSGFLQWLSVYALSLSPDVDVVLLDEPDAHLNATLQRELVSALSSMAKLSNKQVLLATHSPELIRSYDHQRILSVIDRRAKYLQDESGKIKVLSGIGTVHTPTLHALTEQKRLLILEAESDERFLKLIAKQAGFPWPKNVVSWFWTGKASERLQLYLQLLREIPELKAISIRDRDDETDRSVDATLVDKSFLSKQAGFAAMKWRRRHIENYLLFPEAIARAANVPLLEVVDYFADIHALALPKDTGATSISLAVRDARGKEIFTSENSIKSTFHISREDVAKVLTTSEIAEDLTTFFKALEALSS